MISDNSQNGYRSNNQNFRNTKGKGPMNDVHGFSSNVMTNGCEEHAGTHDTQSPKLTREQYEQNIPGDTLLPQSVDLPSAPLSSFPQQSSIVPHNSELTVVPTRPHRSHRLPAYLHDYILPNTITKPAHQLPNENISLNAAFSKHHHIPPEILETESQALPSNMVASAI
ncbi:hypothetical protein H5410_042631 [Solanum commersonii]|uniref:Uncharacterized protein n=1 Tax=Solanum commersonii TaxID=4109 RepID=A0A9J5XW80_SOLCO|nr:hypothetical protein H5410_042631 [Solanum commersonii]